MKSLTPADQLFLWLEKSQQPMHVGGLHVFKFPKNAGAKYITETSDYLKDFTLPEGPFAQRLRFSLSGYYWQLDQRFDLSHHFHHEALPKPGNMNELLALTSSRHSTLLDRKRPLWESYLIEGISGRKFAFYHKVHHSMVDGVAAMRMVLQSYSFDSNRIDMPPIWAANGEPQQRSDAPTADLVTHVRQVLATTKTQLNTIPGVARAVSSFLLQARKNPDNQALLSAPKCILNSRITGSRRFAAASHSLHRFKQLANHYQATINDIVVAVCASALRGYLLSIDELPERPLIAMVPMSVRTDASHSGNQVATILTNLGTHVRDPLQRLEVIKRSIETSKVRFKQMSQEEAVNYSALILAPSAIPMMTGLAPQLQAFNVIISNVTGPDKPMYWNGAQLQGLYPVSIPLDRVALNITLTSYVDSLEFGLTACRRTLPSMQRLLDHIDRAISELEKAAG